MVALAARKAEQDLANAKSKARAESSGNHTSPGDPVSAALEAPAFEAYFLEGLEPALEDIARHGIRVAVNAGGNDVEGLYQAVMGMVKKKGLDLEVAYITGDSVLPTVISTLKTNPSAFPSIYTSTPLSTWTRTHTPFSASAYLGGLGIATAFRAGASVVLCGRVSDASPVIGAAAWWHSWSPTEYDKLANALIAGHLIECSNYVCGGNFTGFTSLKSTPSGSWTSIGYPIAEISSSGSVIITKQSNTGGIVSTETCTAQLLYEIQGPLYHNSSVTADISGATFSQLSPSRVLLSGITGLPPPPTTKCFLTALGGYQAEATYYLTGLHIAAKARMLESQIRAILAPFSPAFSTLQFSVLGAPVPDAESQNGATVPLRIFAQAKSEQALSPQRFIRPIINTIMQGYPGATFHLDFRLGFPRPYFDAFVTRIPQEDVRQVMHLPQKGIEETIPQPPRMQNHDTETPAPQTHPPSPRVNPPTTDLDFGPTTPLPLGAILHARSGDKGPDCNVGFFLPSPKHPKPSSPSNSPSSHSPSSSSNSPSPPSQAWAWLLTFLTPPTLLSLLGAEATRLDASRLPLKRDVFQGLGG
ncbi:MAG: hypothetical protein Q9160_009224, partial [Pyrenula sp. 1 TL-2023]